MNYADLKTTDFTNAANWIAVLPIAAIEQHGPHLPISTDYDIALGNIKAVQAAIPADLKLKFLPILPFGKSDEHENFKGTLSFSAITLTNIIVELGESLSRAGIRKFIIANSHGGNLSVMDIAARELRKRFKMIVVQLSWHRLGYPSGLFSESEQKYGIHGGDIETSQMLHLRPDLVDMSKALDFISRSETMARENTHLTGGSPIPFAWMSEDLNKSGAIGNASLATASKGKELEDFMVQQFIALARDLHKFEL